MFFNGFDGDEQIKTKYYTYFVFSSAQFYLFVVKKTHWNKCAKSSERTNSIRRTYMIKTNKCNIKRKKSQ